MSDHHDNLRAELAALVAASPPTGDRATKVAHRIRRTRSRRLMLATIGGVCVVLLAATVASRSRGGGTTAAPCPARTRRPACGPPP